MRWREWLGVGERRWKKAPDEEVQPAKTLWDWLQLLIVPAILIGVTFIWSATQERSDNSREDRRIAADRAAAGEARRDATLQTYLNQMSALMLDEKLLSSKPGDAVRAVARTVTLATLRRVGRERTVEVVSFLAEAGLLAKRTNAAPVVNIQRVNLGSPDFSGIDLSHLSLGALGLAHANFEGAKLVGADLTSAGLTGANLRDANLWKANLTKASLWKADLTGASISEANLTRANLTDAILAHAILANSNLRNAFLGNADLRGARLTFADLRGAILEGADLTNADLRSADLRGAYLVNAVLEGADLKFAKLKGAIGLPNGTP